MAGTGTQKTETKKKDAGQVIASGRAVLGVELGSTRIKGTLIGPDFTPLASGAHGWENKLRDGVWTYDMEDVWAGIAACVDDLIVDVRSQYDVNLTDLKAAGFSGMMHGYVALDGDGELLVPFRTWRNTITQEASAALTELFGYPMPQRWTIAHLYQAILNGEPHVAKIARVTTIAGYVHWKLTGEWVVGMNEGSGIMPVDPETGDYYQSMIDAFEKAAADRGAKLSLRTVLPTVLPAGAKAGALTEKGAALVDPKGRISSGVLLCPPEGDAGTGMIATNSIRVRTGNVSAGTSAFAMIVLEKELSKVHPEIDLVLTPDGSLVGMAHSNNCTTDLDAWVSLFGEAAAALGAKVSTDDLYTRLYGAALDGASDAGGLLAYGYISGEHVTGFSEGRPLLVRSPDSEFTLANVMRAHLYTALGALRTGLDVMTKDEGVPVEEIRGHGGFFKTANVGQRMMAAATDRPVSVMETAGEGGSWGMALLAAYAVRDDQSLPLPDFLDRVFADSAVTVVDPDPEDVAGFDTFFARYTAGLPIEAAAIDALPSKDSSDE